MSHLTRSTHISPDDVSSSPESHESSVSGHQATESSLPHLSNEPDMPGENTPIATAKSIGSSAARLSTEAATTTPLPRQRMPRRTPGAQALRNDILMVSDGPHDPFDRLDVTTVTQATSRGKRPNSPDTMRDLSTQQHRETRRNQRQRSFDPLPPQQQERSAPERAGAPSFTPPTTLRQAELFSSLTEFVAIDAPVSEEQTQDTSQEEMHDDTRGDTREEAHGKAEAETGAEQPHAEPHEKPHGESHPDSQVATLMRLSQDATWLKTPAGELYARVPVREHVEVLPLNEKSFDFRRWLTARYYQATQQAVYPGAVIRVAETCIARAEYEATPAEVHVRFAPGEDGALYLDLANRAWEVARITPDGWTILSLAEAPVAFRRPHGLLPLPTPHRDATRADLERLKRYLNVASEEEWRLAVGWLLGVFHPRGPYPVLALTGPHGAAKSSATRYLRKLVDPVKALLRETPRNTRDLAIAAKNSRILAYDNLSSLPAWLSDALCRMATDSGFATRSLYSNDEESLFEARRPAIINSIDEVTERGDLASRAIVVTLADIPPAERKEEEELERRWREDHPLILGALLDVICAALREKPRVHLTSAPRMADFVAWVTAAEPRLGWEREAFLRLFTERQNEATDVVLESSLVAQALLRFLDGAQTAWEGTSSDLLQALSDIARVMTGTLPHDWPRSPQVLKNQLRRLEPTLKLRGITMSFRRTNEKRLLKLERAPGSGESRQEQAHQAQHEEVNQQEPLAS